MITDMTDLGDKMRGLIDQYCPHDQSGWVPAVQVHKMVEDLRRDKPDLLAGWLDERAPEILHQYVLTLMRSRRAAIPAPDVKAERVAAYYRQYSCVDGVVKVAADMTGKDHLFVHDRYETLARTNGMLSAFHAAVAARLGDDQVTADVFDAESYERMFRSIVSGNMSEDGNLYPGSSGYSN